MDFVTIALIIGVVALIALAIAAPKMAQNINKDLGLERGQPEETRAASEKEIKIYERINKGSHGDLFVSEGYLPDGLNANDEHVVMTTLVGGTPYGTSKKVFFNGKAWNVARKYIYYSAKENAVLEPETKVSVIWEMYKGKYHFRYVIPAPYLEEEQV